MRILNLITRSELRGAEVFAGQLTDGLARRGHKLALVSLYRNTRTPAVLATADDVEHRELDGSRKRGLERQVFRRWSETVREFQPDVIIAHAFHALKYAALSRKLGISRVPLVYRNVSVASNWSGFVRREWGSWLVRSLDRVVSVSQASATDFCQYYRFPQPQASVIRRGVAVPERLDREYWRQQLEQLVGRRLTGPVLMHLGGMTAEKGHQALITIFEKVVQQQPQASLICFGDGPLRPEIASRIASSPAGGQIHLSGNHPQARDYLTGADLMLLTSRIEGIPGVVLEASARAVPTVSTRVGAVSEAVEDGRTGRLIPLHQPDEFARAVCELLAAPGQRTAMGTAAREQVSRLHSMEACLDEFEGLLRQLQRDAVHVPSNESRRALQSTH